MGDTDIRMETVASPMQWLHIYHLYRRAFPPAERKPFSVIVAMWRKGNTDVWYLTRGGRFAGFATTINSSELILLDYLAIAPTQRGQGVGSQALRALLAHYAGKGIFVEIESIYENAPNQESRLRRRRFYLRSGFSPLGVLATVFGVKMELLGVNCAMDFARYHAFYRDSYSPQAAQNVEEAFFPDDGPLRG